MEAFQDTKTHLQYDHKEKVNESPARKVETFSLKRKEHANEPAKN